MPSTFEQQSARRKFIYFGLILLLFTGSLLHRKLIVNVQADELLLRDVGRGKADLTDSALRLTLSGVRGVAVTSLWLAAIERQKHHEWNELELAVDSLTHLQPRFLAPWLFQGWNLSFNVAVECDRARDKYYYISRGIALLSRGEEKNDPGQAVPPQPWPASPDLRFEIGRTYKSKIGQSDENKTMRCLFDMSCIPPGERNPDQFMAAGPQGKQLNLAKFKLFCESYPRLVRRLRERLSGFEKPEAVVQFLTDNKDIPGRLENRSNLEDDQRLTEFPILPPQNRAALDQCAYPDWRSPALTSSFEDFDVFVCQRAWHTYAQVPLPDPEADFDPTKFDRLKHKRPRLNSTVFRSYPARAQSFVAEELQKDGWFDDSGWIINGWFDTVAAGPFVVVGTGRKYHSGEAWNKAHELCRSFGLRTGLYMEPAEMKKLVSEANRLGPYSDPAKKLRAAEVNRGPVNFDSFFQQTKVERSAETVAARKAVFEVEHAGAADLNVVDIYRDKVLPQWLDLLLRNAEFRKINFIQEETYELQAKLFRELQNRDFRYKILLENLVKDMGCAALSWWPIGTSLGVEPYLDAPSKEEKAPPNVLKFVLEKKGLKVFPIRDVEGPFDQLFLLEGPEVEALKPVAMLLARLAVWPPPPSDRSVPDFALARYVVWPPRAGIAGMGPEIGLGLQAVWPPEKGFASPDQMALVGGAGAAAAWPAPTFLMLSSAEQRRIPTQLGSHRHPPTGQGWTPLVPWTSVLQARNYVRWMSPRVDQGP